MDYHKQYYQDNKEHFLAQQKEYTARNKDRIRAYKAQYYQDNKERISAIHKQRYAINKEHITAVNTTHRRSLRQQALKTLGNKCTQCGFTDYRALQIDHITGGGTQERLRIGDLAIHHRIIRGEPGYQLLCANCNWIKRAENDEH